MAVAHNQARRLAILLMTLAGVVFLVSLLVVLTYHQDVSVLEDAVVRQMALTTWVVIFAVLLAVLLIAMIVLLATTQPATTTRVDESGLMGGMEAQGLTVPDGMMLLRCGQCGNTFTAMEISERPYYSTCPHCGARGVLNY